MRLIADTSVSVPVWIEFVVGIGALSAAGAAIWHSVLGPLVSLAHKVEDVWPMSQKMAEELSNTPDVFKVLDQIVREFRSDSGSTMRDLLNRLEKAADESASAIYALALADQTAQRLAERDRNDLQKLLIQLAQIAAAGGRMEAAAAGVASDLAASHRRSDIAVAGEGAQSGIGADAASQQTESEKQRP